MKIETKCLHAGYTPKNTEPRVVPIVQSTTYVYDSTDDVAAVFDDPTKSLIYSFRSPNEYVAFSLPPAIRVLGVMAK